MPEPEKKVKKPKREYHQVTEEGSLKNIVFDFNAMNQRSSIDETNIKRDLNPSEALDEQNISDLNLS